MNTSIMETWRNATTHRNAIEEQFAEDLLSRALITTVIEAGSFLAVALVAFVGNSLICIAMYRNRALRNITNIFVLSLAISDLCMACFCMPISIGILIRGRWVYPPFACKFQAFFIYVLAGVSLYTMAVTAVNRYYKVVKPRKYRGIFTTKSTLFIVASVWVTIGSSIGILLGIGWLHVKYESAKASCVMFAWLGSKPLTYVYQLVAFVVFFIVPTALITRCYRKVFNTVRNHSRNISKPLTRKGHSRNDGRIVNNDELKMTKTLYRVVLAFAICWAPVIIYELIVISSNVFNFHEKLPRQVHLIWLYFGTLSSAVNAFIYGATNRAFKQEFKAIFRCNRALVAPSSSPRTETTAYTLQSTFIEV